MYAGHKQEDLENTQDSEIRREHRKTNMESRRKSAVRVGRRQEIQKQKRIKKDENGATKEGGCL